MFVWTINDVIGAVLLMSAALLWAFVFAWHYASKALRSIRRTFRNVWSRRNG